MNFLFDYQINYSSDSENVTHLPFSIFALTQQGLEHQKTNIGNQDSGNLYLGRNILIGAVADGCTRGNNLNGKSYSQVGAYISGYLTVRLIRKLILKKHTPIDALLPAFEQEFILNYKKSLNALNPWKFEKNQIIKNLLLSTIIFFLITEEEYVVANCGDGEVIINGEAHDLEKHSGKYFAQNLVDIKRAENGLYFIKPDYQFNKVAIGRTNELESLLITTDGFLDQDIKRHCVFSKFFHESIKENRSSGFVDRRAEFRKDFLDPIMKMKNGRIYPQDDATFISVKRIVES